MAKDRSFDIVSEVDMQVIDDCVNVALKEINNRFDFKGQNITIELNKGEKKHADFMDGDRHIFCRNGGRSWNGICGNECGGSYQSDAHHFSGN